jgi:hypothetical protein
MVLPNQFDARLMVAREDALDQRVI